MTHEKSRFSFLFFLFLVSGFLALGFLFGGCGDRTEAPLVEPESEPPKVSLAMWKDYVSTNVIQLFEADAKIDVEITLYEGLDELHGMLKEQNHLYDLAIVDNGLLAEYLDEDLIGQFDHDALPNLAEIGAEFKGHSTDPQNEVSIPYSWGLVALVYNKQKIKKPPSSWSDLWEEKYAKKIGLNNDEEELHAIACLSLGLNPADNDPAVIKKGKDHLRSLLDNASVVDDSLNIVDAIGKGTDIWIGMAYSGDALAAAQENPNIGYVEPDEKTLHFIDNFILTRQARHPRNAHRFVDFFTTPKMAAQNANEICVATVVDKAGPWLLEELRDDPVQRREVLKRSLEYPPMTEQRRILRDEIYEMINVRFYSIYKGINERSKPLEDEKIN